MSPRPSTPGGHQPPSEDPTSPLRQQVAERLFDEKKRIASRSRVREFVFGSMDGLLVPLGVVSGVAAGTGNIRAVIVAGLAEAFAGALSMAAGEYLSSEGETKPMALGQIKRIVQTIGNERALAILQQALDIEQQGGLMLPDGSRRHTPGGVFFRLIKEQTTREERRQIRFY
jgi:VIT family/PHAX RNA-binding domain